MADVFCQQLKPVPGSNLQSLQPLLTNLCLQVLLWELTMLVENESQSVTGAYLPELLQLIDLLGSDLTSPELFLL